MRLSLSNEISSFFLTDFIGVRNVVFFSKQYRVAPLSACVIGFDAQCDSKQMDSWFLMQQSSFFVVISMGGHVIKLS
jgi:hypothetical protein